MCFAHKPQVQEEVFYIMLVLLRFAVKWNIDYEDKWVHMSKRKLRYEIDGHFFYDYLKECGFNNRWNEYGGYYIKVMFA